MAALIPWLGSFFSGLVGYLSAYITKRVAIAVAVLASFTALVTVFWTAISALMSGLATALPSGALEVCACFVPLDVLHADLSIVLAGYVARITYDYYVSGLQLAAAAN